MLVGQYDYVLDTKGRLNFPSKFREEMGETFIVCRWMDKCLAAFPLAEFDKVAAKIEEKGLVKGRQVTRMLYSSAAEVTPDKQGRIQLTPRLLAHAGLEKDVTVVGMGNAAPEIAAAADVRTACNDEDGVAKAIERYVLGQKGED